MSDHMTEMYQEALSALPAAPMPGVNATVKPLVWRGSTATCPFGEYSVDRDFDDDMAHAPWCCWAPNESLGHFATLPEAKAAAQTHFEARILSALDAPAHPEGVKDDRRLLIVALDALEAIDSELVLAGHLKELVDCALAARNDSSPSHPEPVAQEAVDWCQPKDCGKIKPRQFVVMFEDADVGIAIFTDEDEARDYFERATMSYNCYLFGALPRHPSPVAHPSPPPDQGEDDLVQRLGNAVTQLRAHGAFIGFADAISEAANSISTLRARVVELEASATTQAGASEAEPVTKELQQLREYAKAATIAITGLTGGGSEYFSKQIGDIYTADLDFCVKRIRESREAANHRWKDAVRRATPPDSDAVRAERERCAKIAARLLTGYDNGDDGFGVEEAIRSGRAAK